MGKGKQFEQKFKEDWLKAFPNSFIYRLPDQISGYYNSKNPCDFICFINEDDCEEIPTLYLIETKAHEGNTIPFSAISQYDSLIKYEHVLNIQCLVIIWFTDHDRVIAVPISTLKQMKQDGKKSVNIKTIEEERYNYIEIPSVKKRVFLDSDYSVLAR